MNASAPGLFDDTAMISGVGFRSRVVRSSLGDRFIKPFAEGVKAVQDQGCRYIVQIGDPGGHTQTSGSTSGVGYLRKMLDVVLFPEIWKLRTDS
jgi:hypothetical protein